MDRIEPIQPSPPAIAPIDTTRVRRISRQADRPRPDQQAPRREQEGSEQEPRKPREWRASEEDEQDEQAEDDGRPRIDVRA